MSEFLYRNRRAASVENEIIRVIVTEEGGHIAAMSHKAIGLNPLWTPPWPSIEPSTYDRIINLEYGSSDEAYLLSGIMGHSICLDTYGKPSPEEFLAGMPVHGEGPVAPYCVKSDRNTISMRAVLPKAQLEFSREISVFENSGLIRIQEYVENLSYSDRPIAWTQHVTMGPPFLEQGRTQFRIPVTRSKVIDEDFTGGRGAQKSGAEFEGLLCPRKDGGIIDLSLYSSEPVSSGFTIHLIDPVLDQAFFMAWSPTFKILFGYIWRRTDFPWLCRWEENHFRSDPPWNSQTVTCAIEFGVSPMLESRRQMIARGSLFGTPAFRWIPAKSRLNAEYFAFITVANSIPQSVQWHGGDTVQLG